MVCEWCAAIRDESLYKILVDLQHAYDITREELVRRAHSCGYSSAKIALFRDSAKLALPRARGSVRGVSALPSLPYSLTSIAITKYYM